MKKSPYLFALLSFISFSCEMDNENENMELNAAFGKVKKSKVKICHNPSGNNPKILEVNINALEAHLAHGDVQMIDNDGDGWFSLENLCAPGIDCDDEDSNINPGNEEIPYNGKDDDCNPETLDDDLDGDGFTIEFDCDDNNPDIFPDSVEICDNGIDENCNNQVDENCFSIDNPIAIYNFNGDFLDSSENQFHLSPTNQVTFDVGQDCSNSGSANFNYSYLSNQEIPLNVNGEYTISFWVNPDDIESSLTGGQYFFDFRYANNNFEAATISLFQKKLYYSIYGFGSEFGNMELENGKWYHCVVNHNSNDNILKFYINGSLDFESTFDGDFVLTNTPMRIGARSLNAISPAFGSVDDVRIYNYSLSIDEVSTIYGLEKEDCFNFSGDIIAYYPFNGNANDESTFSNNGIVNGAILTSDRYDNANSAYFFDGVDDFIQVPNSPQNTLGSNDFTIAVWFKSTSGNEGVIFNKRNTSSCSQANGPSVGMSQTSAINNNYFASRIRRDRNNGDYRLNSTISVNDDMWHFGVITRQNNELKLFLDGTEITSTSIISGIDFSTTLDLFIGKTVYCSGNHFTGYIDDFTMYSRALDIDEIYYLMTTTTAIL